MLNNQPMGFYHPATLVKDAQRHGVRFAPIDVQVSDWECRVEPDGRVRLGLMYVNGLRAEIGRAIAGGRGLAVRGPRFAVRGPGGATVTTRWNPGRQSPIAARNAANDDQSMLEDTQEGGRFCNICAHEWSEPERVRRGRAASNQPDPRTANPRTREPADQRASRPSKI